MARRTFAVTKSLALSPSVRGVTLSAVDGAPFEFAAGQWVDVHVQHERGAIKRAYSIASAPGSLGLPSTPSASSFELAITRVEGGVMSNVLHTLDVGAQVDVDGPHGFFTREPAHEARPAVFVGTGTGLAPLRAMLQIATRSADGPPMVLLFGCRSVADILWRDELDEWTRACPRLRVEVTLSRADDAWSGRRGYVQTHLQDVMHGLSAPQVYVCGLSRMVQDVRRVLKQDLGLDRKQIQTERYD